MWQARPRRSRALVSATYHIAVPSSRRVAFTTQVVPATAYVSVVFYAGLIRLPALPEVGFVATDKLLHALVFGGLALLLAHAGRWFRPGASVARKLAVGAF